MEHLDNLKIRDFDNFAAKEKKISSLITPTFLIFYRINDLDYMEKLYVKESAESKGNVVRSEFSGMLWYESLDGELIRSQVYQNGKYY
jgi:hypothetical protein